MALVAVTTLLLLGSAFRADAVVTPRAPLKKTAAPVKSAVPAAGVPAVLQPMVTALSRFPAYSGYVALMRNPSVNGPIAKFASSHQCTFLVPTNAALAAITTKNPRLTLAERAAIIQYNVLGQQLTPQQLASAKVGQGYTTPIRGTQVQKYNPSGSAPGTLWLGPAAATTQPELATVGPRAILLGRTMNVLGVNNLMVPPSLKRKVVR